MTTLFSWKRKVALLEKKKSMFCGLCISKIRSEFLEQAVLSITRTDQEHRFVRS